jgi:UDP-glucose 4-epimerase
MHVVVTGGAGYVGSHIAHALVAEGIDVTVVDNLSAGHRWAVSPRARFVEGDLEDPSCRSRALDACDAIVHCAGSISVEQSTRLPLAYFRNNVVASIALIEAGVAFGVKAFVFSSSAAVYAPQPGALTEDGALAPVNPYGRSKLMIEQVLADTHAAHGLAYSALRYFNAAGADAMAGLGEAHHPETHLLPIALEVAAGRRASLSVFGDDYPTRDGTCERDFVDVRDLAQAHVASIRHLQSGGESGPLNLGTGRGTTVNELANRTAHITGRSIARDVQPRRKGDPPTLVADPRRAQDVLGWRATRGLDETIAAAWEFAQRAGTGA